MGRNFVCANRMAKRNAWRATTRETNDRNRFGDESSSRIYNIKIGFASKLFFERSLLLFSFYFFTVSLSGKPIERDKSIDMRYTSASRWDYDTRNSITRWCLDTSLLPPFLFASSLLVSFVGSSALTHISSRILALTTLICPLSSSTHHRFLLSSNHQKTRHSYPRAHMRYIYAWLVWYFCSNGLLSSLLGTYSWMHESFIMAERRLTAWVNTRIIFIYV